MEKYNKQKAILIALLKWVETEFFGIFVFLFFIAVAKPFGALANIIFGLVQHWMTTGMKTTPEETAEIIFRLRFPIA